MYLIIYFIFIKLKKNGIYFLASVYYRFDQLNDYAYEAVLAQIEARDGTRQFRTIANYLKEIKNIKNIKRRILIEKYALKDSVTKEERKRLKEEKKKI